MQRAGYEALCAAVPLIISDKKVLREYFGESALYVDNTSAAIKKKVEILLNNELKYKRLMEIKRTEKMKSQGIFKGEDLYLKSLEFLNQNYGKQGAHFYNIVRGIQFSQVKPDRIRKSIAAERTFGTDIISQRYMLQQLERIADELERRLMKNESKGKTITLKLKYTDFTIQTRSKTVAHWIQKKVDFFPIVEELLLQYPIEKSVRLLGISFSKLDNIEVTDQRSISVQLCFDF
jgi:DNA polymerase-4